MIRVICAWCGKDMGTKPGHSQGPSHSMCPECKAQEMATFEKEKQKCLESTRSRSAMCSSPATRS